jgi:hypothetical protein
MLPGRFALDIVRIALLPGKESTELTSGFLNRVTLSFSPESLELGSASVLVGNKASRKGSGLNV